MTVERLLSAIRVAADAIADGDAPFALAVLLGALEEDGPSDRQHACPDCGLQLQWPGEVDAHRRAVHRSEPDEAAVVGVAT